MSEWRGVLYDSDAPALQQFIAEESGELALFRVHDDEQITPWLALGDAGEIECIATNEQQLLLRLKHANEGDDSLSPSAVRYGLFLYPQMLRTEVFYTRVSFENFGDDGAIRVQRTTQTREHPLGLEWDGGWGLLDAELCELLPCEYDRKGDYLCGHLIAMCKDGLYGAFDSRRRTLIIPCRFDRIQAWNDHLFANWPLHQPDDERCSVFNEGGELLGEFEYWAHTPSEYLHCFGMIVRRAKHFGLADKNGALIHSVRYEREMDIGRTKLLGRPDYRALKSAKSSKTLLMRDADCEILTSLLHKDGGCTMSIDNADVVLHENTLPDVYPDSPAIVAVIDLPVTQQRYFALLSSWLSWEAGVVLKQVDDRLVPLLHDEQKLIRDLLTKMASFVAVD